MKLHGKLAFVDIGTGSWKLTATDGKTYALFGAIERSLDGHQVVAEGEPVDQMSNAMSSAPMIAVSSVRSA